MDKQSVLDYIDGLYKAFREDIEMALDNPNSGLSAYIIGTQNCGENVVSMQWANFSDVEEGSNG